MKSARHRSQRGNAILEFTLVCIPLIFVIISIVELSRGMWVYATLAHSINRATRYSVVHGGMCAAASSSCTVTIADVAGVIVTGATGLDSTQLSVLLETTSTSYTCNPLSTCLSNTTAWPPSADYTVGMPVTITGTYPFRSAIAMFWPGAGKVQFGSFILGAKSRDDIAF